MNSEKKMIYFICTGNSCRSQMAEGFARHYAGDKIKVFSGGVEAHGLNPTAVRVMAERGVDISNHTSDLIDKDILYGSDLVITLCGDAKDRCPALPMPIEHIHWDLEDPAKVTGTEEEIMNKFREIRDLIDKNVKKILRQAL